MSRRAFAMLGVLVAVLMSTSSLASARGPLEQSEVTFLLRSGVSPSRVRTLVQRFGVAFEPTDEALAAVRGAGGDRALIEALRASRTPRSAATPVATIPSPPISSPPPTSPSPETPPQSARPARPSDESPPPYRPSALEPEMVPVKVTPSRELMMSRYEVSNRIYLAFCRRSGAAEPKPPYWGTPDDHPVVNVSWHDAVTYCRWLSLETGRTYRLPTEAEWEAGARGGRLVRAYPWGNEDPYPRSCFGRGSPCKLGSFRPNGFGLHDMTGSVAEWCEDRFEAGGDARVVRGGGWIEPLHSPERVAIEQRERLAPDKRRNDVGFRVVRDP
jgi:formylglycine-generating enzyme required for sulfatase activity